MLKIAIEAMERGWVPEPLIRVGIRRLLGQRLRTQSGQSSLTRLQAELEDSPIALHTDKANAQHYELPAEFFRRIMGRHMKYSACYWPEGVTTLDAAEAAMLALTSERADIHDGQTILELGCGWGSLTLWLAEHYPRSTVTAVSNSHPQRRFIERACAERGLNNVQVITADMNDFSIDRRFDRVVSVEMFEHMRNYRELMARIAGWLRPDGALFVHVFSHREQAYPFETEGDDNWMGKYFFTGGLMPSRDLLPRFQDDLRLEDQWHLNGRHYQRTCEAWLANQYRHRDAIMAVFRDTYGPADAARWFQRWKVFFLACAELFGYRGGEEWGVSHYRFRR